MSPLKSPTPDIHAGFTYTPLFCEENIWHLARKLHRLGLADTDLFVLFFSNAHRSIVLCRQRLARSAPCTVWDYHVVLQTRLGRDNWIFDFDSSLSFPCRLNDYFSQTFPDQHVLPRTCRTKIRRIPAAAYLLRFSSDRSHMAGKIPASRFPDYAAIVPAAACSPIPLSDYWDMTKQLDDGSPVFEPDAYPDYTVDRTGSRSGSCRW